MNKKRGFTLIEAVVSIALIGILSLVVYSLFFSMSRISGYSEDQIERYAIVKVIKENVVYAVRNDSEIYGTGKNIPTSAGGTLSDLKIKDKAGQEYPEYSFDLKYEEDTAYGTRMYKVTLKHKKGGSEDKFEFCFEVYKP